MFYTTVEGRIGWGGRCILDDVKPLDLLPFVCQGTGTVWTAGFGRRRWCDGPRDP